MITEVLSDSLENVAQNFTSKVEMQKVGAKSTCASNLKLGFLPQTGLHTLLVWHWFRISKIFLSSVLSGAAHMTIVLFL